MSKKNKALGIGNAIVDAICKIDENFLKSHNLQKGTMKLIDDYELKKLKKEINFSETSPINLFKTKCDIISPCALGGAINAFNKNKLQCKSIVGAANNQLEDSTIGEWLNKNNIVYAPDYLVNSGGVIAIASEINKTENLLEKQLEKISNRLKFVLEESKKKNEPTNLIAKRIAWERINS